MRITHSILFVSDGSTLLCSFGLFLKTTCQENTKAGSQTFNHGVSYTVEKKVFLFSNSVDTLSVNKSGTGCACEKSKEPFFSVLNQETNGWKGSRTLFLSHRFALMASAKVVNFFTNRKNLYIWYILVKPDRTMKSFIGLTSGCSTGRTNH